jgi:hypothetical protein
MPHARLEYFIALETLAPRTSLVVVIVWPIALSLCLFSL